MHFRYALMLVSANVLASAIVTSSIQLRPPSAPGCRERTPLRVSAIRASIPDARFAAEAQAVDTGVSPRIPILLSTARSPSYAAGRNGRHARGTDVPRLAQTGSNSLPW